MNQYDVFPQFTDDARVWVYGFTRNLSAQEKQVVEHTLRDFIGQWKTHGERVTGDYKVCYNKFAILAEESTAVISGCSIDSSVRVFKKIRESHRLDALNHHLIHYRDGKEILSVERDRFQKLISSSDISDATIVFNNTIHTVGEIRQGLWETPLVKSWHSQAFQLSA